MTKGFPRWIRKDSESEPVLKSTDKLLSLLAKDWSEQHSTKVDAGARARSPKGGCLTPR